MNWFDTSGLTNLAKTALKEAQKTIDKALDIQDDSSEDVENLSSSASKSVTSPVTAHDSTDFFASWGLTVSAESVQDEPTKRPVVTESPSKAAPSVWGSFAGSFFEQPEEEKTGTIIRPPKAKSMNVINDGSYNSQDDLFSKSQLVMSAEGAENLNLKKDKNSKTDENLYEDDRRNSSRLAGLSLVSSINSSDSVDVLSQSHSTPDSEAEPIYSMSQSSSLEKKLNSESVEILPDSVLSPSSIECLAFDSYSSDKCSSESLIGSPEDGGDSSAKKSTPTHPIEDRGDTADSVSLVADEDEDTISYNSISECTAPTVLDNDDNCLSPYPKHKVESKKKCDKEITLLEQPLQSKMQPEISGNSSNDGSWSDRTLNADNDLIEPDVEESKKDGADPEENLLEKLSDSSSFYNVNVSEMVRSDGSAFYNVDKQQCNPPGSSESSQKDNSVKERTSPISSDSIKSDLVKIGSDRTSGHTSGDELETATSSDIEIIPSPNGDSHGKFSPGKYAFKPSKFDGTTSPNLVDLVLGKSLASKIRGHNRELSEASVQSNTSDESQGSENDRLMRRLGEMAEILEAREVRLMEVSRSNAELAERNAQLKSQLESLMAKEETGDIKTITDDYTQRMSALEKKFQQAIREKDQLRKQLDNLKTESSSRKNSSELENMLKEKDDMIAQLQEEGEKLARQQLQHSNIIKKLRAKEKDNEQVIKSLRDKVAEQSNELDRLKRGIAAKEELEVSQIESVYRLTTANKKLETELMETKSSLDDATHRLESTKTSLDSARRELAELTRSNAELLRRSQSQAQAEREAAIDKTENERLRAQLQQLRSEMMQEEKRWLSRVDSLRHELESARAACLEPAGAGAGAAAAGGACAGAGAGTSGAGALLAQLATLQRSVLDREQAHKAASGHMARQIAEAEASLAKAVERERLTREENQTLQDQLATSQGLLEDAQNKLTELTAHCQQYVDKLQATEEQLNSKSRELDKLREELTSQISELGRRVTELEQLLDNERTALDTEKKRNTILQEQLATRGDISPPHSVSSDTLSNSFWQEETVGPCLSGSGGGWTQMGSVQELVASLQRREGELRAAAEGARRAAAERRALQDSVAALQHQLQLYQSVQEQYDALLQMYGEKEEQLAETRLDLQDVTQLYKQQLDELVRLRQLR